MDDRPFEVSQLVRVSCSGCPALNTHSCGRHINGGVFPIHMLSSGGAGRYASVMLDVSGTPYGTRCGCPHGQLTPVAPHTLVWPYEPADIPYYGYRD